MAVTGLTEAHPEDSAIVCALVRRLVAWARANRPDALVVIDFPDFNFRLARRIKALGIPVVYYISPQIWAWRAKRLEAIRRFADLVLVIFPFEEAIYREGGVPVEFVGHPLVDLARPSAPRAAFLSVAAAVSRRRRPSRILPGSRPNEVTRILPDLMVAAKKIRLRLAERAVPRGARAEPRRLPFRVALRGRADAHPGARGRDRRDPRRGQRRADRLGHGDGADGASRYADGDRLPRVADLVSAAAASRHGRQGRAWST